MMTKKNHVVELYKEDKLLFYLRTHPEWYRILARYPDSYKEFVKEAKEELKLTTYHKIENVKNKISLFGMLSEYMKQN